MKDDFNFLTLSIFLYDDFADFYKIVRKIYDIRIKNNKFQISKEIIDIKEYCNPKSGGSHFPKFSFWDLKENSGKIFFISNYEDGLINLCRKIRLDLKCSLIMCTMSNEISDCKRMFYYISDLEERLIHVYKEDKWIYYEEGTPLAFEEVKTYKKRLIKKRLDNDLIKKYLLEFGVDFSKIDEDINNFMTMELKEW